jgi:PAS domain S-box-containing protein
LLYNTFYIVEFLSVFFLAYLSWLIIKKTEKKISDYLYILLSIFITGYLVSNLALEYFTIKGYSPVIPYNSAIFFAGLQAPVLFLFSLFFSRRILTKIIDKSFILLIVLMAIYFAWLALTNKYINSIEVIETIRIISFSKLYNLFGIYFCIYVLLSLSILVYKYFSSDGTHKKKLLIFIVGIIAAYSVGSWFSLILPILGNSKLEIIGPLGPIILCISFTYAIHKHRFMDTRIATRKTVYFGLMLMYFTLSLIIVSKVVNDFYLFWPMIASFIILAEPLKHLFSMLTARLYASAFTYRETLHQLAREVFNHIEKDELLSYTTNTIRSSMKLKSVAILDQHACQKIYPAITQALHNQPQPLVLEDLKHQDTPAQSLYEELETHEIELVIPLCEEGSTTGALLLGDKKNNELFSNEDLHALKKIANALVIAIAKAEHHHQMKIAYENQLSELDLIKTFGEKIITTIELAPLANNILEQLQALFPPLTQAALLLFDSPQLHLFATGNVTARLDTKQEFFASFFQAQPVQLFTAETMPPAVLAALAQQGCPLCPPLLALALSYKNKEIGIIFLCWHPELNATDKKPEDQAAFLATLIPQMAVALENAKDFEKIKASKLQYETALQTMSNGIITVNNKLEILTMNNYAEKILGLKASTVVGTPYHQIWQFVSSTDLIKATLNWQKTFLEHETIIKIKTREIPVQVTTEILKDHAQKPVGVMLSLKDLLKVKELQDRLARANSNFDIFIQLGKVAANLRHKIFNPLQIINFTCSIIEMKAGKGKLTATAQKELLQEIRTQSDRIVAAVDKVQTEAQPLELDLHQIDFKTICQHALAEMAAGFEQKELLVKKDLQALPKIIGDPDKLLEALFGLLGEVVAYCRHNTLLIIRTKKTKDQILFQVQYLTDKLTLPTREYKAVAINAVTYTALKDNVNYGLRGFDGIIAAHGGFKNIQYKKTTSQLFSVQLTVNLPIKSKGWAPSTLNTSTWTSPQPALSKQNKKELTLLVIDDEVNVTQVLRFMLESEGYSNIYIAHSGAEALELAENKTIDCALVDILMPGMDGMETMARLRALQKDIQLIVISETAADQRYGQEHSLQPGHAGVRLVLEKPLNFAALTQELEKIIREKVGQQALPRPLKAHLDLFIGNSPPMQRLYRQIKQVASTEAMILITGQSGTGKELVAAAIHQKSHRNQGPLVIVNCAAIPETLWEAELFGYTRGAFTGAQQDSKGKFEEAKGGTIFLDEIGKMPLHLQVKFLRTLQPLAGKTHITRLGSNKSLALDIRVLAATNLDLHQAVQENKFLPDLYFRLKGITLHTPSLQERSADIPLLAEYFLAEYNKKYQQQKKFSVAAGKLLTNYAWPGNVRELQHLVENMVIIAPQPEIKPFDLPPEVRGKTKPVAKIKEKITNLEKTAIQAALQKFEQNQTRAAAYLGIPRTTLRERAKQYGIDLA